jgi:hypothetical protein
MASSSGGDHHVMIIIPSLAGKSHTMPASSYTCNAHIHARHTGCCIFHKKRAFGESSSESDSDSEKDDAGDGGGSGGGDGQEGGEKKQDRHMRIAQPKHPPVRPWETYHA